MQLCPLQILLQTPQITLGYNYALALEFKSTFIECWCIKQMQHLNDRQNKAATHSCSTSHRPQTSHTQDSWMLLSSHIRVHIISLRPPWDPHSPGLVVLCRLPLFRNGNLVLGFPCSLLAEDEEEVEEDIFLAVLSWLLEQNESKLELLAGQWGSRTHTGPGGAPLQRRLLLPADSESTVTLRPHEL